MIYINNRNITIQKLLHVSLVFLLIFNDIGFAASSLKGQAECNLLAPCSIFAPIVRIEEKGKGQYIIVEDETKKDAQIIQYKNNIIEEDIAFMYRSLLIGQALDLGLHADGLKALIERHLSHTDFKKYKWRELYEENEAICLPYERADTGQIQILKYYPKVVGDIFPPCCL